MLYKGCAFTDITVERKVSKQLGTSEVWAIAGCTSVIFCGGHAPPKIHMRNLPEGSFTYYYCVAGTKSTSLSTSCLLLLLLFSLLLVKRCQYSQCRGNLGISQLVSLTISILNRIERQHNRNWDSKPSPTRSKTASEVYSQVWIALRPRFPILELLE